MNIFVFNLSNQRLRRFTSGVIYANSYGKTIFHFNFNTFDWDLAPTKTAVFSCRGNNYYEPLDDNNMCKVPEEVLHEGYFTLSVHGGGLVTNSLRVPVAKAPDGILPDDGAKSGVVFVPEISDKKILSWTNNGGLKNPAPVDLNPYDEWVDDETVTEYIWEEE